MKTTHAIMPLLAAALLTPAATLTGSGRQTPVVIPFEAANKNIFIRATVGHSRTLSFMLDTGVKPAVIDLSTAKALGLPLGDAVPVGGAGQEVVTGYLLGTSSYRLSGLDGFAQPLAIAIPLGDLARSSGHEIAGILGFDFISHFVTQIDYARHTITLHDPSTYDYRGLGDVLPVTFNAAGHPVVRARIVDGDRPPIDGAFVVDTGSGAALILNAPFVKREGLQTITPRTVPWPAGRGIGGGIAGTVGRLTSLQIGRFSIDNPVAVFSDVSTGAFASTETEGNIGAAVLEKFTIVLDYARSRMILEPNVRFAERISLNRTGLSLVSEGNGFKTFRVAAVIDDSPASEAGIRAGDVLLAIDGAPASKRTLSAVRERLTTAPESHLVLKRGGQRVEMTLRPGPPM